MKPYEMITADKVPRSELDKIKTRKINEPIMTIEVEVWGDNLNIPIPPKFKNKRVRVTVEGV